MWYKLKRIMMRPNGVEKQVRPTVIKETFTFTPWDFTYKSLAKSWYKINQIVLESTIRFTWSAQIYMNICPTNSTSSQDIVKVAFSTISWNWRQIQTGRDGSSWTTHQSWWSISTNTDYHVKVTIGRDSWIMDFNGTSTTLTYSTTEKNVIASVFNSTTPYGQTPTYDSNVVPRTITYTVTYQ